MHLIHWVWGGFTNIAIKQSQCFYCALDLKIEAGLTAGSRRTYGKGLVFVCLRGDEWPVSSRWLVCTIKLSKRKDFSLIVPFREELWNSDLCATAGELAGLCKGEGEGQTEFSALRPAWHSSRTGCGDKCRSISSRLGRLISSLSQRTDLRAVTPWGQCIPAHRQQVTLKPTWQQIFAAWGAFLPVTAALRHLRSPLLFCSTSILVPAFCVKC